MRDAVVLYINEQRHEVADRHALRSLSDYLRRDCGLVGTKIVCSEGDCGACTVLVGRPAADGATLDYQPVDSCIRFLFQLDGCHVVTVEGLAEPGQLNGVQQAMVDCYGSQCGFCTPGFVMAMTGMLQQSRPQDDEAWRLGLTGNLCRCTGYEQILEAGAAAAEACEADALGKRYAPAEMLAEFASLATDDVEVRARLHAGDHCVAMPATLDAALVFLAKHPEAVIAAGATDLGVRANKSGQLPATILDLNRIADLDFVRHEEDAVVCGARATWATLANELRNAAPEFAAVLDRFGGPQIRAVGTIAGNIANGSPIADSLPFLFITEAAIEATSRDGVRWIPIGEFYHGYKQLELRPGELITAVRIPLPPADDLLKLYKVSRRRDLDISGFTAGIRLRLAGETIQSAWIALGGVGPTVVRAAKAEAFLQGRELSEDAFRAAGEIAVGEVAPISDVRGSAEYRRQLVRNIFMKFFHQTDQQPQIA